MGKISGKLSTLLRDAPPETQVDLHVMLRRGLGPGEVRTLVDDLSRLTAGESPPPEYLAATDIVFLCSALGDVPAIADLPGVVWVDADSRASMDELIDS